MEDIAAPIDGSEGSAKMRVPYRKQSMMRRAFEAFEAFAVFMAVTTALMVTMTSVTFEILWTLAGSHDSLGLGMAVAFYSPVATLILVISVGAALWASHRTHFRQPAAKTSN